MSEQSAGEGYQDLLYIWATLGAFSAIPWSYIFFIDPWHVRTGADTNAMGYSIIELITNPLPIGVYLEVALVWGAFLTGVAFLFYTGIVLLTVLIDAYKHFKGVASNE